MASSETLATRQGSLVSTEDLIIRIAHRRIKCGSDRGAGSVLGFVDSVGSSPSPFVRIAVRPHCIAN
jgi:hypothetical protein